MLADWVGIALVHVIPQAWDWRFSNMPRGGQFVMVTLTNGEQVAGFFGPSSFASSDSNHRDIYIEEEYDVEEGGTWASRPERVGVLIPDREISYIEFWQRT